MNISKFDTANVFLKISEGTITKRLLWEYVKNKAANRERKKK